MSFNAVLLLGSNLGDREKNILGAVSSIKSEIGTCILESSFYESKAWGFKSKQKFLNLVLVVKTEFSAWEVLAKILIIENKLGRIRGAKKYDSRTIDIDILFFDKQVLHSKKLTIPHRQLHKRMFALVPLLEIMPDFVHPVFNKSIQQLFDECNDDLEVVKFVSLSG